MGDNVLVLGSSRIPIVPPVYMIKIEVLSAGIFIYNYAFGLIIINIIILPGNGI